MSTEETSKTGAAAAAAKTAPGGKAGKAAAQPKAMASASKGGAKAKAAASSETAASESPGDTGPAAADLRPVMRKKELIEKVQARSGIAKKDIKPVLEALLSELGLALANGRELAMPPMGKLKVNREKKMPNGRVLILKLRQGGGRAGTQADSED